MRHVFLLATLALGIHSAALAQTAPMAAAPVVATTPGDSFYQPEQQVTKRAAPDTAANGVAVASAAEPLATAAGIEMLQQGGTAIDAALAIAIALTVVEPQSSGIGGGGFLVFREGKSGQIFTIDGRETAPAAAGPDHFLKADGSPMAFRDAVAGGASVGVPGTMALIATAHERWGRLPWASLFAPAIRMAEEGVPVSLRLNRFSSAMGERLAGSPAARIFLDDEGRPWPVGHVLKQPDLAATLRILAAEGTDAFYKGAIGAAISTAVAEAPRNPAQLTAADLAAYQAKEREPLCRPYRVWHICTMGPPSSGGIAILQILLQLERFDLGKMGATSVEAQHLFAESQRLAYADREVFGADSDHVPVPVEGLLEPAYIKARSALIRADRAMAEATAGRPRGMQAANNQPLGDIPATSHLLAADFDGSVASYTSTIEGPFGSGLVAGGFLLNNELTDFDFLPVHDNAPAANRVQPGKRPRSSMAPVIVLDSFGRPVAAFGAAGGATIIAQVAKALIARLDWGMSVEAALAAPQIIADRNGLRYEAGSALAAIAPQLTAMGHGNVRAASLPLKANGVVRAAGGWRAAADPRSDGQALGLALVPVAAAEDAGGDDAAENMAGNLAGAGE